MSTLPQITKIWSYKAKIWTQVHLCLMTTQTSFLSVAFYVFLCLTFSFIQSTTIYWVSIYSMSGTVLGSGEKSSKQTYYLSSGNCYTSVDSILFFCGFLSLSLSLTLFISMSSLQVYGPFFFNYLMSALLCLAVLISLCLFNLSWPLTLLLLPSFSFLIFFFITMAKM